MVYCRQCDAEVVAETDDTRGFTCCTKCGKVLDETAFSTDPTFSKTAGGASQVDGNFVPDGGVAPGLGRVRGARIFGYQVDSHEKTIAKGKHEISQVAERLGVRPREDMTGAAHRLYKLAVQRNFTRGRRTQQVAGACLYIVCRQEGRPYMLIDFSDVLQTNVYVLGSVFLQLCRLLRLEHHPIMQRPVDPSLFIHRFADRLELGAKANAVATTALRLVSSMKRDWMQTGRRPSGVCGAALFIAAHIHGLPRGKREVVSVVHVGEATLQKRLSEFKETGASNLTVDEFDKRAEVMTKATGSKEQAADDHLGVGKGELICEHKEKKDVVHFAHGMCIVCFKQFDSVSGGVKGGFDPPAFRAAQAKDEAEASLASLKALRAAEGLGDEEDDLGDEEELGDEIEQLLGGEMRGMANRAVPASQLPPVSGAALAATKRKRGSTGGADGEDAEMDDAALMPPPPSKGEGKVAGGSAPVKDKGKAAAVSPVKGKGKGKGKAAAVPASPVATGGATQQSQTKGAEGGKDVPPTEEEIAALALETDTLSDVDDADIDMYIHTEEESKLKELVWTSLNKEYLEEQAAKTAATDATEKAAKAKLAERANAEAEADGVQRANELGSPASAKKKKQKRAQPMAPAAGSGAKSAGEATAALLAKRSRVSTKINYEALDKLFKDADHTRDKSQTATAKARAPSAAAAKPPAPPAPAPPTKKGSHFSMPSGKKKKPAAKRLGGLTTGAPPQKKA